MDDILDFCLSTPATTITFLPRRSTRAEELKPIDVRSRCKTRFDGSFGRRLDLERRLHRLSNYDGLTGLPTLARLSRLMSRLIGRARRCGRGFAFVSVDLDGLRLVCEAYGREEADILLKRAASIVRAFAPPNSIVARNGTDGFIVLLVDHPSAADAAATVQHILDAIAAPSGTAGTAVTTTASAGIAMFPGDGTDFDALGRNAVAAMRESRVKHHGMFRSHSGDVALESRLRLRLETDLRRAVENNELTLYYQPQFDARTGRGFGIEVLARWLRNDVVVADPCDFIPVAEQTALIATYGSWALEQACKTVRRWSGPGMKSLTLCVNVSAHQIDGTFAALVQRTLDSSGFSADRLELEITESGLMSDTEVVIECLRQLKAMGVRIAIDDFGTGYSSLSYLSRLPVDRLKLDKSLVHNLTSQWKDVAILRSIIRLGKDLGVAVIAEGVETEQQLQILTQLGCSQVQGFLFGRPAPPKAAYAMLTRRWGNRPTEPAEAIGIVAGTSRAS